LALLLPLDLHQPNQENSLAYPTVLIKKGSLMRNRIIFICALLLLSSATSFAEGYNYVTAAELRDQMKSSVQLSILDIQFEGAYKAGHFANALATYAYPVKTDASRSLIDAQLSNLKPNGPVIIVSHRGGGGAMRALDYLKSKGLEASRLFILKRGMKDWPYPALVEVSEDQ